MFSFLRISSPQTTVLPLNYRKLEEDPFAVNTAHMAAEHKSAMLAFQSGFKFDAVDLIFSAGGSVVAMMILHQVHVQVFVRSRERRKLITQGILHVPAENVMLNWQVIEMRTCHVHGST